MSKTRKVEVVDSYAAIRALKQVPPAAAPAELRPAGAGKTALPPKKLIECFACGYKFQLHGRAPTTTCNKCRTVLDLTDHIVDQRWSGTLKTGGAVRILPNGVVEGGTLIAHDLVLEGVIEAGQVRVLRRLEVRRSGRFAEASVQATDLLIAPGAVVQLRQPAAYRDVEVHGALHAALTATGAVVLRATAVFTGQLRAAHLTVEEGAGLCAEVCVAP
jgi:cytoskeletal protein CcmA (bactofilin family)